jgi:MFS family permease
MLVSTAGRPRAFAIIWRLRGLLAFNLTAAAAGAMVIVNTVVFVRSLMRLGEADVAIALAAFGAGSMTAALLLPSILERVSDRSVMLTGAAGQVLGLLLVGAVSVASAPSWLALLAIWALIGLSYSSVLTPSGRLLKRSSHQEDRPSIFAAQFALSHACWLLTYPLAGWLGATFSMAAAAFALAGVAALGSLAALRLWAADDPTTLGHVHEALPADHPHLRDARPAARGLEHAHAYVIDEFHRHWPGRA